jgi:hypothetical protein
MQWPYNQDFAEYMRAGNRVKRREKALKNLD